MRGAFVAQMGRKTSTNLEFEAPSASNACQAFQVMLKEWSPGGSNHQHKTYPPVERGNISHQTGSSENHRLKSLSAFVGDMLVPRKVFKYRKFSGPRPSRPFIMSI